MYSGCSWPFPAACRTCRRPDARFERFRGGLLAAAAREDEKSFDEVVRGYRASQGLFTVYTNLEENRVLIEIAPEQFERLFLCNVTLEAGDGLYFDSGAMLDNFPFIFKRVGKRIQLIHKNVYYRAETGTPIGRAVERAVSSSIVGSAKIESRPHPERKSVLVDLSSFFVQDYAGWPTPWAATRSTLYLIAARAIWGR